MLTELTQIKGTNAKIAKLREMINSESGENVVNFFWYALNPHLTYGATELPVYEVGTGAPNYRQIFINLGVLSTMNRSNDSLKLISDTLTLAGDSHLEFGALILKDLKCGISIANFNKALKGTKYEERFKVKEYPCMLVSSDFEKFVKNHDFSKGVICQEKCDGVRFNAIVQRQSDDTYSVTYYGRSGKRMYIDSPELDEDFITMAQSITNGERDSSGAVFDGEILIRRNGEILDRKTGNGIINKAVRGTITTEECAELYIVIWDALYHEDFISEHCAIGYDSRLSMLQNAHSRIKSDRVGIVPTFIVYSSAEALNMFKVCRAEGKEGVILKSRDSLWANTRSTDCVKIKDILECDLVVREWVEGTGKYTGMLGALVCESVDGLLSVGVGSGFTDTERRTLTPDTVVGKVVTVQYNARITDKTTSKESLFLPRFVELRTDKTLADTLSQIK